jgi:hypothetical protein
VIYVLRDGKLVEKPVNQSRDFGSLATPMLSPRFETIESPVTGKPVTSWRDRERDMRAADAVDARDVPRGPIEKRKKDRARPDSAPFKWF